MYYDETGQPVQRVRVGEKIGKHESWKTKLVPSDDPVKIETVRWIFDTYANRTMGRRNIAKELNLRGVPTIRGGKWSAATVLAILKNPRPVK